MSFMGTRGVPARYGGFETAIEEIGRRLAERGHEITVYCRRPVDGEELPSEFLGMKLVTLPALRHRAAETLSHSALSALYAAIKGRQDMVFLFNAANAPFLPILRARGLPVAVHVDGLEWRRSKWSGAGQRYYRAVEALSVRWADALIADARGIADYYREEFAASTELISYGAPVLEELPDDRLAALELERDRFHLVVARFEPENHVELIVRAYSQSSAELPLVVVGAAPYSDEYTASIREIAERDPRIRLVGSVWDQDQLNQLYAHALQYQHGHSVGGTNPSLLRAMGAGAAVSAYDVGFNREVIGEHGQYFSDVSGIVASLEVAEADPADRRRVGGELRSRAAELYRWDDVADRYEELALRLADGWSRRGESSGRRLDAPGWRPSPRLESSAGGTT